MTPLSWVAAALFALFTGISVLLLVDHLRATDRRHGAALGWLVFDVLFGVVALTLVLAQVDGAFWVVFAVYLLRRVVEDRTRRRTANAG